jgi:hypothetical protein
MPKKMKNETLDGFLNDQSKTKHVMWGLQYKRRKKKQGTAKVGAANKPSNAAQV